MVVKSVPSCLPNINHEKGWSDFKNLSRKNKHDLTIWSSRNKIFHIKNDKHDRDKKQKQTTSKTTASCPTLFTEAPSSLTYKKITFREMIGKENKSERHIYFQNKVQKSLAGLKIREPNNHLFWIRNPYLGM